MTITSHKVSAVIPCLNEEETIGICIKKALKAFKELGIDGEVVVGDNGSTDRSVEIATQLGARVAHQPIRGYGAALQAAVEAAKGDYIIMGDADDSYDWSNLAPFIEKLEEGNDLVMGNRFKGGIMPGAMPPLHRYLGNPVLSFLSRVAYKAPVGDFHCGMRAFTKEAFGKINATTTGMEFATELVVRAVRAGLKITEVPIVLYPDKRSGQPHLRSFRDGWRHLRFIMTYAPNYLYLAPGGALFLTGVLLLAILVKGPVRLGGFYMGPHFLAVGCLMTLVGFNVLNLGLLARTMMAGQSPPVKDKVVDWLSLHFTLEKGILIGALPLLSGTLAYFTLLWRWLKFNLPMDDSIHIVFVASTAIAIGVTVIFSSFLLGMMLKGNDNQISDGL